MQTLLANLRGKGFHTLGVVLAAALSVVMSFGCGGSSSSLPDMSESYADPGERIIRSDAYAGYLVMHVDESLGAKLDTSKTLMATSGDDGGLAYIQSTIDEHPGVTLRRSVDIDADKLDALRSRLEAQSGKTLADFNSIFKIDTPDLDEAVSLYNALKGKIGVSKIYPAQKTSPSSITTVPDLTGHQGYLYPESTDGGLNAEAAWNAGVTGQGASVILMESGWNYNHEDLNIDGPSYPCELGSADEGCSRGIMHGTSMVGVIGALHNNHGTDGFSPDADISFRGASHVDDIDSIILRMLNGDESDGEMYPGTVFLIASATKGMLAGDASCTEEPYGCIPTSILPSNQNAIEYAIAAGISVIEAAGNGYVDLNDAANYGTVYTNISTNDSGSIMVGASMGATKNRADFSNFGSRVNVFAWGAGVAAPGFPYPGSPFVWTNTGSPVPPNDETNAYYTNLFGGTSSASSMIAGAAALVQSYAKQELGETTRYLMPAKMREILVNSGVPQSGGGGSIGKQPRIDIAMGLVDSLVSNAKAAYPELESNSELTDAKIAVLRGMGIGIMCGVVDADNHVVVGANDPSCPESSLWPEGNYISKPYDFDGDGRADLVKFRNGWWHVDLSSKGGDADGYGAWDIAVEFPPLPGSTVWPYVTDMNSDGRCDFVAYDKLNGTFYVALTDNDLIEHNTWHGWDWVIDYSAEWHDEYTVDPNNAKYSRPFIAEYNNDGFADIGIADSDGYVRVDYGNGAEAGFGQFDWSDQLITDAMLAQAPGWAYLTVAGDFENSGVQYFAVKVPDTLPDAGKMYIIPQDGVSFRHDWEWLEKMGVGPIFGGNDHVPLLAKFDDVGGALNIGLKNGDWLVTADSYDSLLSISPTDIYGGSECHPVTGRFDGDDLDDRAVMCPNEWRIAYSSNAYSSLRSANGARYISLEYDATKNDMPGRTYSGGITYSYAKDLMNEYKAQQLGQPVPIMVDMITMSSGN
jgi:hypothetical protein